MQTLTPHTESTRGQLGQGIYSLAELRLYLSLYGKPEDGDSALYWLDHALNPVAHESRQPDYSFSDFISLLVVRELVGMGVRVGRIQEAERYGRRRFGLDRPYVTNEVMTDGSLVFFASDEERQVEVANRGGGQQVDRRAVAAYLRRVVYSADGLAIAWQPVKHVVLRPGVQFGEPTVDGTRVPTSAVADVAEAAGVVEAAKRLGVTRTAAAAAVKFEHRLAALRG